MKKVIKILAGSFLTNTALTVTLFMPVDMNVATWNN